MILDGRLCLSHRDEGWLAVTDLHFGFEVTKRLQGGLFPLWGMETIEHRLTTVVREYRPQTLVLAGDLIDGRGAHLAVAALIGSLRPLVSGEVICLSGNHDTGAVRRFVRFRREWETARFRFHHGHRPEQLARRDDGRIQITGHLHPSINLRDGAGLALKLPAFIQERSEERGERWILPAFSPWAGGRNWKAYALPADARRWACSPQRVFEVVGD